MLNLNGEVIGINTAINAQAQGIGIAIPINTIKQVLNDLIQIGKVAHPYIGVSAGDLIPDLKSSLGSMELPLGRLFQIVQPIMQVLNREMLFVNLMGTKLQIVLN